jgi:hypothetical protein
MLLGTHVWSHPSSARRRLRPAQYHFLDIHQNVSQPSSLFPCPFRPGVSITKMLTTGLALASVAISPSENPTLINVYDRDGFSFDVSGRQDAARRDLKRLEETRVTSQSLIQHRLLDLRYYLVVIL